jgi:type I restriction enzyme S subunit
LVKINQGLQIAISKRLTKKEEGAYFYITNEFLRKNSKYTYYVKDPNPSVVCNEDDILMTRTGNTGQVVTGVTGVFHNNFFKIKYSANLTNKVYLYYFLTLRKTNKRILSLAGTSTIPDLNHSDFYSIIMPVPSIEEQQKIAAILSEADAKIEKEQTQKAQLEALKKGLMQQLLTGKKRVKV